MSCTPIRVWIAFCVAGCQPATIEPPRRDVELQEPAPFQPPSPGQDKFDWVRLVSGEWLKGEVRVLRSDTLEFDSAKLDTLKLDWDDVAELRIPRSVVLGFPRREVWTGTSLRVANKKFVLGQGTELQPKTFDREDVLSMVVGQQEESDYWSGKMTLGATARSGNTNSIDASSYLFLRRETANTRLDGSYTGAFSKLDGRQTTNSNRVDTQYDVFLTDRLYCRALAARYYRDLFQNTRNRITTSAGLGYDILEENQTDWNITVGLGYQYVQFDSVPPNRDDAEDTAVVTLGTKYHWNLTADLEFEARYDITVPMPRTNAYNHHAAIVLSLDLIEDFDLDVSGFWDRVGQPSADDQGGVPKNDDYRIVVGVGYSF